MSLLQIKKLEAPLDLRRESLNITGTSTSSTTGNANHTPTDEGVFTCYFNRTVTATDFQQPTNPDESPCFSITVSVYDECYYFIYNTTLIATQTNVRTNNHICFKLEMSDADFQRLGGCNIYVHVVINNPNTTAENHVQFRQQFSNNYHETIKHIHIYDEKKVDMVYWSTRQPLPNIGESESIREGITLGEDAFIHVRTRGLWGKNVMLSIYERSLENTAVARIVAPMGQNRKVVVVSMKYLLACYCNKTNTTYNEGDPIDLTFYIKTDNLPTERLEPPPLTVTSPSIPGGGVTTQPENEQPPADPFRKESGDLHLEIVMGEEALPTVNNGTVFIQVNAGEVGIVEPNRYRDFLIGYMCHIEGIGKLAEKADNTTDTTPEVTIYPLHTYEILLSDLVACGIISLTEAIYMAPITNPEIVRTDIQIQSERDQLQANFNKTTQQLSNNTTDLLINRFLDDTYYLNGITQPAFADSKAIRKLLTQIQHKTEVFDSDTSDNEALYYICRDAWQGSSSRANTRYDASQECPFGEFFLNYVGANYKLFIARRDTGSNIQQYDEQDNVRPISPNQNDERTAIAFHKGTSDASIGCLTFNLLWDNTVDTSIYTTSESQRNERRRQNNYDAFNNKLYPEVNNTKKLNFVCIDERHAISPVTDRRYHDLINPNGVIQT